MIILIILGVLILVILVLAFTGVFGDFRKWISPSNNVKDIVDSCASQCTMGSQYDFCSVNKTLKTEDSEYTGTCYTYSVADGFGVFGISKCPSLNCEEIVGCSSWTYKEKNQVFHVSVAGDDMVSKGAVEFCKVA